MRCIIMAVGLAVSVVATTVSCIRVRQEHCIVNGGDVHCVDGYFCVAALREDVVGTKDGGDGCTINKGLASREPTRFVRVQYGLPSSLEARTADPSEDIDSVAGVLLNAVDGCESAGPYLKDEKAVDDLEDEWLGVMEVRDHLESKTTLRVEDALLTEEHVESINDFNAAIDDWLGDCSE